MYVSRMGKPGEIFYEEVKTPEADGKNVLVKIHAVAICGTDKHGFTDGSMEGQIWGHEYSGTVIDPGEMDSVKPGDKVIIPKASE